MLLFQSQPVQFFQYAYPFSTPSLTPQYLTQAIQSLTPQNYLTTLRPLLDALQNTSDEKQVAFGSILRQVNASLLAGPAGRTELQRAFLYELATAVAPAWVAQEAKNDYAAIKTEADKKKFRQENGFYNARTKQYEIQDNTYNNCRHYVLRKYYEFLKEFLSPEVKERLGPDSFTINNKEFFDRPKDFDYQAKDSPVVCFTLSQWNKLSATEQESYLTGEAGVAFVSSSLPKNAKKLIGFLRAGDFVSTNHNINHKPNEKGNPHVGVYDGKGHVVNIHNPLSSYTVKQYIRDATRDITVRRPATRGSTLLSAIPLTEGPNFWTQSIKPTSIPSLSDNFIVPEPAPASLRSGKKKQQ